MWLKFLKICTNWRFSTGNWVARRGSIPREEVKKVSVHIQLVRIEEMILVGWKHGPNWACASHTPRDFSRPHSFDCYCRGRNENCPHCYCMCLKETNPFFLLYKLKTKHMMRCKLYIYSWAWCGREHFRPFWYFQKGISHLFENNHKTYLALKNNKQQGKQITISYLQNVINELQLMLFKYCTNYLK